MEVDRREDREEEVDATEAGRGGILGRANPFDELVVEAWVVEVVVVVCWGNRLEGGLGVILPGLAGDDSPCNRDF
jgi:hypothetical protein